MSSTCHPALTYSDRMISGNKIWVTGLLIGVGLVVAATHTPSRLVAADGVSRSSPQSAPPAEVSRTEVFRQVRALTDIGRDMFSDPSLSASGTISCAFCHSPSRAF